MKPDDLIEMLAERPFVPLRAHLSNGRIHDIRHPDMAIVGHDVVALGVQSDNEDYPRIRIVDIHHINEVELLTRRGEGDDGI